MTICTPPMALFILPPFLHVNISKQDSTFLKLSYQETPLEYKWVCSEEKDKWNFLAYPLHNVKGVLLKCKVLIE